MENRCTVTPSAIAGGYADLGDAEHTMLSNDQLAEAIDATVKYLEGVSPYGTLHQTLADHLALLLQVQAARAGMCG